MLATYVLPIVHSAHNIIYNFHIKGRIIIVHIAMCTLSSLPKKQRRQVIYLSGESMSIIIIREGRAPERVHPVCVGYGHTKLLKGVYICWN